MDNPAITVCPDCGGLIEKQADSCPSCELIKKLRKQGVSLPLGVENAEFQPCRTLYPEKVNSNWYNLWSPSKLSIPFYFACPACRKIWNFSYSHNLKNGPAPLKIPMRCPDCNSKGEAWAESLTSMVEEYRLNLAVWELRDAIIRAAQAEDYPALIGLKLRRAYLDMRTLAWDAGGPSPLDDKPSDKWPTVETFLSFFEPMLKVIDKWWVDEPFMVRILEERVNSRIDSLHKRSVEILKNKRTAKAYNEFLDGFIKNADTDRVSDPLTAEVMLQRSILTVPSFFSKDFIEPLLVNMNWLWIFKSEAHILFVKEPESFKKKHRGKDFLCTISKARQGDLPALSHLLKWDRIWLTCPWVEELIESNAYDRQFNTALSEAFSDRSGGPAKPGCLPKASKPELVQAREDAQFLYDRFFSQLGLETKRTSPAALIRRFVETAGSFPENYEGSYQESRYFKQFLERNLRR